MMDDEKKNPVKHKLFHMVFESQAFKDMRSGIDKLFLSPSWWICEKKASNGFVKPLPKTQRAKDINDYMDLSECKKVITAANREAEKTRSATSFIHPLNNTFGLSIPLVAENRIIGFCGIYGLKVLPQAAMLELVSSHVKAIVSELLKQAELSKIYELVRPRAIALSTVHTIHRLISSTLDIKELFPRIARLSLQVLRAERARISMVDKSTRKLITVASVDYRKTKDMFRPTASSMTEKRVVQTGVNVRKKHIICVPLVDEEVCGVIAVMDKVDKQGFTIFDQEILTTLAEQAIIAIKNAQLYQEQEDITIGTIKSLAHLLDSKFPRIYTHTDFFVEFMIELGKEMGLSKNELKLLHYASILPDVGKLVVPEEILKKPKALSGREKKIIKTHTLKGIEILQYLDVLKPVVPIVLHHHERYDGRGYPDKLKGRNIPLGSRIMAVADAFEAMVCHRPYRNPLPFRMAVSEIRRQAGSQFDPDVVKAFMSLANNGKIEQLIRKHHETLKKVF